MVYHLKNWKFIQDWARALPEWTSDIFADALIELSKELGEPSLINIGLVKRKVNPLVECAKKTITQEGFEACLIASREDVAEIFRGPGHNSKFDKYLEILDRMFDKLKTTFYEEHRL